MTLLYIILGCVLVVSFITGVVLTSKEKKQKSSDIVDKNVVNNVAVSNDDIPSVQTIQSPVAQASQTTVVPSVQVTPVVTQTSVAAPVAKVEVPSTLSSVNMVPGAVPVTENIQTTSVVFNNTVNPNVVAQAPSDSTVPVAPVVQQTVQPIVQQTVQPVAVSQPVTTTQTVPVVQPSTPVSQPVIQQSVPVVTQTVHVPSNAPVANVVPVSSDGDNVL